MAYADQKQNKTIAMGSAALVQLGLGAALLTGFVVRSGVVRRESCMNVSPTAGIATARPAAGQKRLMKGVISGKANPRRAQAW